MSDEIIQEPIEITKNLSEVEQNETRTKTEKPKRPLTQKQLDNLAKMRQKKQVLKEVKKLVPDLEKKSLPPVQEEPQVQQVPFQLPTFSTTTLLTTGLFASLIGLVLFKKKTQIIVEPVTIHRTQHYQNLQEVPRTSNLNLF